MLFNFDKLVSCDRLADCILWVGLLAFHQALVSNPQDAFVIWVFTSVLYNGKREEVVKIAREHAKDQVNFVPEICGFLKLNQMKNLSELASLVEDCVNALNETHSGMYQMVPYSTFGLIVDCCTIPEFPNPLHVMSGIAQLRKGLFVVRSNYVKEKNSSRLPLSSLFR
ncbi:hypothetical protein Patl1_29251 [Pistacia atlantica]|uniref:Uncharacterized protein n=1 Tax=Pistacia atlantica TaxID=434234 RepID=A0ACC1BDZ3_9ROSI|nr:hypothetical protein Patl1_29251 [Pistacia atlantica]